MCHDHHDDTLQTFAAGRGIDHEAIDENTLLQCFRGLVHVSHLHGTSWIQRGHWHQAGQSKATSAWMQVWHG